MLKKYFDKLISPINRLYKRFNWGMRTKLIVLFLVIKVVPLLLIAVLAWTQTSDMGISLKSRMSELTYTLDTSLTKTGDVAIADAIDAIEDRAIKEIERTTTDLANRVAAFLYERDGDILFAANLAPSQRIYKAFIENKKSLIVDPGEWVLAPDNKSWVQKDAPTEQVINTSRNSENDINFHYMPPRPYEYKNVPIYTEMTYVSLSGEELVKVTADDRMDKARKNVSIKRNTFAGSETYFNELKKLKPGEIYVSDVIGEYVGSKIIGVYTPENADKRSIPYQPENEAYAGKENPVGKKFKGIVRFATPVVQNGEIAGYVTLALNHDHIIELMEHIMPTDERYTEIYDASAGNYAFIWDYEGRSIVHPRHHSIVGYDKDTGEQHVPWLEKSIYDAWLASGKSYSDFIVDVPTFDNQSTSKKGSPEQIKAGDVGLDCRYLNHAPQCTGWFDLAGDGGSGSFVILWSGLTKLTTAAAIPYYTGKYGNKGVGFGFVAVGAGVDDFYAPALETQAELDEIIKEADKILTDIDEDAQAFINRAVASIASTLTISTLIMIFAVVWIAILMASAFTKSITNLTNGFSLFHSGKRQFRFDNINNDEISMLKKSFNEMADGIVDSVSSPVVIVDNNYNILYMNSLAEDYYNIKFDKVAGLACYSIVAYEKDSESDPIRAFKEGRTVDVYYDEEKGTYSQVSAILLNDIDDNSNGYIITTTDVTDIIMKDKKFDEQAKLLNTIFYASPDMIWLKDAVNFNYQLVNNKFASILDRPLDEFVNLTSIDSFSNELHKRIEESDDYVRKTLSPHTTELDITYADGHTEITETIRTPILDENGKLISILGIGRDVTARVTTERELIETQKELNETLIKAHSANAAKSDFLARMSHEIRTPMNAIIGLANIIQSTMEDPNHDDDSIMTYIDHIEKSSKHLLGLLNDVLDFSKIEAGKIELDIVSFSIADIADDVDVIIRPKCDEKSLEFAVNIDENITYNIHSDALRLKQVLINLLGNSLKFTPEKGMIGLDIKEVEKQGDKALIRFEVSDTGIGIDTKTQAKLFEPFEQADSQISTLYGGTGLGLSISRNIVNLLGGDIELDSVINEYSKFSFELWVKISELYTNKMTDDARVPINNNDILKGKHILLADDVELNRIVIREVLRPYELIIDEVADGSEAVEKFEKSDINYYDIILMDATMPVMNGYEAAENIRALDRTDAKDIVIIAVTANAFKDDIDRVMASGMNAHMAKPVNAQKLVELIKEYIIKRDV